MRRLPVYAMTTLATMAMTGTLAMTSQAAVKTVVIGGGSLGIGNQLSGQMIHWDCKRPELSIPSAPEQDTSQSSFAEQVVNLVNQERAKAGLNPLTVAHGVTAAANVRAKEIKKSFSHTRPDGTDFSTVLTQNGVPFKGSGENIAYGQKTPEEVMNGWMNSAGHRANILNKDFTTIGVGHYQNEAGVNYWTQLFTY